MDFFWTRVIQLKRHLRLFKVAQPVSTISPLSLTFIYEISSLHIKQGLIDLCLDLNCLIKLKITGGYSSSNLILLIEILQNLAMLKSLEFEELSLSDKMDSDRFHNTINSNTQLGGLESAYFIHTAIELNDEESDDSINKFDLLFNFILRSFPNLKRIKLEDAFVNARGVINLDSRTINSYKMSNWIFRFGDTIPFIMNLENSGGISMIESCKIILRGRMKID